MIVHLSLQIHGSLQAVPDTEGIPGEDFDGFHIIVFGQQMAEADGGCRHGHFPPAGIGHRVQFEAVIGRTVLPQAAHPDFQEGIPFPVADGRKLLRRTADGIVHRGAVVLEPAVREVHAPQRDGVEHPRPVEPRPPVEGARFEQAEFHFVRFQDDRSHFLKNPTVE